MASRKRERYRSTFVKSSFFPFFEHMALALLALLCLSGVLAAPTLPSMTTHLTSSTSVTATTTTVLSPTAPASTTLPTTVHLFNSTLTSTRTTAGQMTSATACPDACSVCRCDGGAVDCSRPPFTLPSSPQQPPTNLKLLSRVPCNVAAYTTSLLDACMH